jgi:hypothetical protein
MMIRNLVAKFSATISEKMVPPRRKHVSPVKVWFEPDIDSERNRELAKSACVLGETIDISRNGISFIIPVIRIQEKYFVGQERRLNVEIDLPTGKVALQAIGRRYEKVGIHLSTERFLIGARIVSMDGPDEEAYLHFLKNGRLVTKQTSLELGID